MRSFFHSKCSPKLLSHFQASVSGGNILDETQQIGSPHRDGGRTANGFCINCLKSSKLKCILKCILKYIFRYIFECLLSELERDTLSRRYFRDTTRRYPKHWKWHSAHRERHTMRFVETAVLDWNSLSLFESLKLRLQLISRTRTLPSCSHQPDSELRSPKLHAVCVSFRSS